MENQLIVRRKYDTCLTFVGCAAVSYSTIQYPKIDFWRVDFFFQVECMILFLRTDWSLTTYMTISYSTIQYPKIDFWRAEFFFR